MKENSGNNREGYLSGEREEGMAEEKAEGGSSNTEDA